MAEGAREADLQDGKDQDRTAERDSVGAMLARARRERGQEIADVAANLRIRRVYLQAIEERRYAELPGPTYAVGFVRSYAEYLQLDAEFLVERFKSEIAGLERKPSLHFPAPKPEGRVPGGALVVISVLLIALTYGGWYYTNQNDVLDGVLSGEPERLATDVPDAPVGDQASASQSAARATAEDDSGAEDRSAVRTPLPPLDRASEAGGDDAPPAEAASLSPPPEAATDVAAQPATPGTAERAPQAPGVSANSIEGDIAADGAAEPVTAAEPPAAEATADAETEIATAVTETIDPGIPDAPDLPTSANQNSGRVYGVANGESRVVLTATSDSWVQVRSADANLLITRVLRAGDIYRVPDQQGLTLETGNAGGLTVTVDGRTAPPLGRSGDVLRGISLEPQALLSGQAAQ